MNDRTADLFKINDALHALVFDLGGEVLEYSDDASGFFMTDEELNELTHHVAQAMRLPA